MCTTKQAISRLWTSIAIAAVLLIPSGIVSCSASADAEAELVLGAEETENASSALSGSFTIGTQLRTTDYANLRESPKQTGEVLTVLYPESIVTVEESAPVNGYYNIKRQGTVGWVHGSLMVLEKAASSSDTTYPVGTKLVTTGDVNFRKGPGTSYDIIYTLSENTEVVTINKTSPENGFFNVKHDGNSGWVSEKYLTKAGSTVSTKRKEAVARAKAGVGFSYWWGHGRWLATGPTSSNKGSCEGSCPNCSHSGSYGADCSGYVAKIWQVPSSNTELSKDSHPYSTADFDGSNSQWSTVERGSMKIADALVRREDGSGHIMLYESGDGWGSFWAFECKGCAAGCVRNLRNVDSSYKAIRRTGY